MFLYLYWPSHAPRLSQPISSHRPDSSCRLLLWPWQECPALFRRHAIHNTSGSGVFVNLAFASVDRIFTTDPSCWRWNRYESHSRIVTAFHLYENRACLHRTWEGCHSSWSRGCWCPAGWLRGNCIRYRTDLALSIDYIFSMTCRLHSNHRSWKLLRVAFSEYLFIAINPLVYRYWIAGSQNLCLRKQVLGKIPPPSSRAKFAWVWLGRLDKLYILWKLHTWALNGR